MGLNTKTAREGLRLLGRGKSQAWVARKLGVSKTSISYLATGRTWKHIERQARPRDLAEALFAQLNPSPSGWIGRAIEAVRSVSAVAEEFTTDDVWAEIGRQPGIDPRLMGEAMKLAHIERICEPTGGFHAARSEELKRSYRGRPLRVWRSLIL